MTAYIPKITTQLFTLLYARVTLATSLQDSGQFTSDLDPPFPDSFCILS
ncbi:hypothetical protein CES94_22960 [Escherichia coli]|nr:hypothetical protein CES94_22960 [Escherichia coli]